MRDFYVITELGLIVFCHIEKWPLLVESFLNQLKALPFETVNGMKMIKISFDGQESFCIRPLPFFLSRSCPTVLSRTFFSLQTLLPLKSTRSLQ
jgi:hypothetical protein